METNSFGRKFIILILSLFVGLFVGNMGMLAILTLNDLEVNSLLTLTDNLDRSTDTKVLLLGIAVSHLALFTGSALMFWKLASTEDFRQYFCLQKNIRLELFWWLLLLLFASYPLIGASGMLGEYIDFPEWMQTMDSDFAESITGLLSGDGIGKLILNMLVIALLPAIGEELIFRGIIQKELNKVITNPHLVIFITSMLFSGIHLQAAGFLPKLFISYILCYSYYWTNSLKYPMLLHFINNAAMTLALYFGQEQIENLEKTETPDFPWGGVVISLFLCVVIASKILNFLDDNNDQQNDLIANE